jgi:hypothetical protein
MSKRSPVRKLRYGRACILWFQSLIYDVISNIPLRVVAEHSFFPRSGTLISRGAHSRTILSREKRRQNSIQKLRRNFLKGFDWIDIIYEVKRDIPRPWDAFRKWALLTTTVRISSSHFTGFRLIPRGSSEQSDCEIYRLNCFSLVKYIHKL